MLGKLTLAAAAVLTTAAAAGAAPAGGPWGEGQKIDTIAGNHVDLNTPSLDGCPILSPDGRQLFMASNRPRFAGDTRTDLDIWVATRESADEPFGAPVNLPAPVNSAANDFCPTPLRGGRLLFVSNRRIEGVTCGLGDVYMTRLNPRHGWRDPRHLRCAPEGPNSEYDEQGPSLVEIGDGTSQLFFSRSGPVKGDLFVSTRPDGGRFGPADAIDELNSPENDIQPNVRKDGLEIVFSSNHAHLGAQGGQDIYTASRESTDDPWSAPVNVGSGVNKAQNESRPSFSWDARTLLFGRVPGPEGSSDIYVSTR